MGIYVAGLRIHNGKIVNLLMEASLKLTCIKLRKELGHPDLQKSANAKQRPMNGGPSHCWDPLM